MDTMTKLLIIVVIATAVINVIHAYTIVGNVTYTVENDDNLQDTINSINRSLNEYYRRIKSQTLDAFNNPLIGNVDHRMSALVTEHTPTLMELEAMMQSTNEQALSSGNEYARCAQVEQAESILKDATEGMRRCASAADDFLEEYDDQMEEYMGSVETVSHYAFFNVFACVPEGDDLSDDEIEAAENCMNYERFNSHNSMSVLEEILVSIQHDFEIKAELVCSYASNCLKLEIEEASLLSSGLIETVNGCMTQTKVKEDDLQNVLNWANGTLTNHFDYIKENVNEEMNNDEIEIMILDVEGRISDTSETIARLGESMFRKIEEAEAVPVYEHCTVGMSQRAQGILDQANNVLPYCGGQLNILNQEYDESLTTLTTDINYTEQKAGEQILLCVPPGELTEEQNSDAINCVQLEVIDALQSCLALYEKLQDIVQHMNSDLDEFASDARRCVERVQNVAGDQYGAFVYTLESCISQTPGPDTSSLGQSLKQSVKETRATIEELQDAINVANMTLTQLYEDIIDQATAELESGEISTVIAEIAQRASAVNQSVVGMVAEMFRKIDEAEAVPAYQHCTIGVRERAQNVQDQANSNLPRCDDRLEYLDVEHQDALSVFLIDMQNNAQDAADNIMSCVPIGSDPTEEELSAAIACVDSATLESHESFTSMEQQLQAFVESTSLQINDLSYEARKCVEVAQHVSADQTGYLMSTLDECIATTLTTPDLSTTGSSTTITREDLSSTIEDVHQAVKSANATFLERFKHIIDITDAALNNQVIPKVVADTDALVVSSESPVDKLGIQMEGKIREADFNNFTDCTVGKRHEALLILQEVDNSVEECALSVYNVADVYDNQMTYFEERLKAEEKDVYQNLANCIPSTAEPSTEEIAGSFQCITQATSVCIYSTDMFEQMLQSNVETRNYEALEFYEHAVACVHEVVLVASDKSQILVHGIEECIINSYGIMEEVI